MWNPPSHRTPPFQLWILENKCMVGRSCFEFLQKAHGCIMIFEDESEVSDTKIVKDMGNPSPLGDGKWDRANFYWFHAVSPSERSFPSSDIIPNIPYLQVQNLHKPHTEYLTRYKGTLARAQQPPTTEFVTFAWDLWKQAVFEMANWVCKKQNETCRGLREKGRSGNGKPV